MNAPTNETSATPTLRDIEAAVCARFGLTPEILRGPKKHRGIARPRQIVMFLAREMTPLSYPRIGAHFNRDHTTVLFAQRRITELIEKKPKLAEYVKECRALVKPWEKEQAREMSAQPLVTSLPLVRDSAHEGEVVVATPGGAGASRALRQSCEGRRGKVAPT